MLILVFLWALALNIFEYHLPIFFEGLFGSAMAVGVLLSLSSIISLLVDLPEGYLQNYTSRKRLIIVAFALLSVSGIVLFYFGYYFLAAIIGMLLYGAMYDMFDITVYSSIYMESKPEEEGANLSLRDIFESIGAFLGLLLVIFYLIKIEDLNLLVFSLLNLVALVIAAFALKGPTVRQKLKGHKRTLKHFRKIIYRVLRSKPILLITTLSFLDAMWIGLFWAFSPIFMFKLAADNSFFGINIVNEDAIGAIIMAVFILPILCFEYFTGELVNRIRKRAIVATGFLLAGVSTLIMGLSTNSLVGIVAATFLASVGMVIYGPALDYLFDRWTKAAIGIDDSGEAVGVYEISANLGYIAGPLLGGIVVEYFSFGTALAIVGSLFIIFGVVSVFVKLDLAK